MVRVEREEPKEKDAIDTGREGLPSRKGWGMISDAAERFQMINSPLAFQFQKGIGSKGDRGELTTGDPSLRHE